MAIAEGSTVGQGNSTVTPLPGAELQQEMHEQIPCGA